MCVCVCWQRVLCVFMISKRNQKATLCVRGTRRMRNAAAAASADCRHEKMLVAWASRLQRRQRRDNDTKPAPQLWPITLDLFLFYCNNNNNNSNKAATAAMTEKNANNNNKNIKMELGEVPKRGRRARENEGEAWPSFVSIQKRVSRLWSNNALHTMGNITLSLALIWQGTRKATLERDLADLTAG